MLSLLCLGCGLAAAPGPVAVWPASPMEVRVAFSAPQPPGAAEGAAVRIAKPEGKLRVAATRWLDGGRTLALAVDPHPLDAEYAVDLRGDGGKGVAHPYRLRGAVATWREGDAADDPEAEPSWQGWLPGLDPRRAGEGLAGSAEHEGAFKRMRATAGTLTLETILPPGDGGATTLTMTADVPFRASFGFEAEAESAPDASGRHAAVLKAENADGLPLPLTVSLKLEGKGALPSLAVSGCDPEKLALPWAPAPPPASDEVPAPPFALEGGDPARGKEVFLGNVGKCSACHKVGGEGAEIGPALDAPRRRELPWLYHQISTPSAEISADYQTNTLVMKDGRVLMGVVRAEGFDEAKVMDTDAKQTSVRRSEVVEFQPSTTSVMPQGLAAAVGEQGMRDLLAFLAAMRPAPRGD